MDGDIKEELRKAFDESAAKKAKSAEVEKLSRTRMLVIKTAIHGIANNLKPVFEERGKGFEIINPEKNDNLIEVLYYPESAMKQTRGVNTAALRIEFLPQTGVAKVFQRDSFFTPFTEVTTVNIADDSSVNQLTAATYDFAKSLAIK